ncbi:hypothetical protein [Bacillus nitratireducens]|uniref:hypothetical protein n=1 Tax=Bacillus nitratireducens TaxID=2026193 RepID=UPI002E22278F|nr:hypothetical protein [Bacillus nitratireducens]
MKTNYDPYNGERIEGPIVEGVLQAAFKRYGHENYIARNVQTYHDPHWIAETRIQKGNAGIVEDPKEFSSRFSDSIE